MAPLSTVIRAMDIAARTYPIVDSGRLCVLAPAFRELVVECASCGQKNRVKEVAIPVRLSCSQPEDLFETE